MTLYFPPIPAPPLFSLRPEAVKREVKSKGGLSFAHTPTCFTFTLLLSPLFPHHTFLFPLDLCCLHTFNYFFDIQSFCIPLSCSTKFTSLAERLYPGALTMDADAFKVKQRHRPEKLARLFALYHCTTDLSFLPPSPSFPLHTNPSPFHSCGFLASDIRTVYSNTF